MIIKDIELHNFRIYKDTNKISFREEKDKNIFIVSGRNGFGKTTFLMGLVWCLYGRQMGDVDDLYKKEISEQGGYVKYIANSLNRAAKTQNDFNFHVSITFSDVSIPEVPCKEIVIKRSYNSKTDVNDNVEVIIDGYPSELAKEVGQEIFIREFIMPIEIAKFFFFDAEKIVSLAEVNTIEQRRNLSRAYSEVLGIKKYEDMKEELESLRMKLRQESASSEEKAQLKKLKTDVELCEDRMKEISQIIYEDREKISEKRKVVRDIQEKLIRAGSVITVEELQAMRVQSENLEKKQNDLQSELKNFYDIMPFAIAGEKFLEVAMQAISEQEYRNAKFKIDNVSEATNKILTELANMKHPDENITIDYKIRSFYENTFEKLIKKHFFKDTPTVADDFKILHDMSDVEINELTTDLEYIKQSFKEAFKRITENYNQTKNELNLIRRKIRNAENNQEDTITAEYRLDKDKVEREIISIESEINALLREEGGLQLDKIQKGKRIEELSKKLKIASKNKQKDEVILDTIKRLKIFIEEFKEQKKKSLENQILKGLETLMHKKGFVKSVEVEIISDGTIDIVLKNARGEEIKKESLSKGEQQMYATALLRSLVEESDINFPVFIDSPMQKFDEQNDKIHRNKVSQMLEQVA